MHPLGHIHTHAHIYQYMRIKSAHEDIYAIITFYVLYDYQVLLMALKWKFGLCHVTVD